MLRFKWNVNIRGDLMAHGYLEKFIFCQSDEFKENIQTWRTFAFEFLHEVLSLLWGESVVTNIQGNKMGGS